MNEQQLHRASSATAGGEVVLKMSFRPPYDWTHVSSFLGRRALAGIERVDDEGYARTVACDGCWAVIRVAPLHDEHGLELRVRGAEPGALLQLSSAARRMFDGGALSARALEARAEPWRPWRGYGAMYVWRAAAERVVTRGRIDPC